MADQQRRETDITNMYGAGPCLLRAFPEMGRAESLEVLGRWMQTFDGDKTPAERARAALARAQGDAS